MTDLVSDPVTPSTQEDLGHQSTIDIWMTSLLQLAEIFSGQEKMLASANGSPSLDNRT
jgi:hypothetical protein